MTNLKKILGLVGSPYRDGRTSQLVKSALNGANQEGVVTELINLSNNVVDACKDCQPWVCKKNLRCSYQDKAFEYLSQKILNCNALILGSPVYWGDNSGLIKYLTLKMSRVYANSALLNGLPSLGIALAGGTGNGLVSGLRPLYHFFQIMKMRAIEPFPSTHFNFNSAIKESERQGRKLSEIGVQRRKFNSLEEELLWYDEIPYINLNHLEEKNLLAKILVQSLPSPKNADFSFDLIQADNLRLENKKSDYLKKINQIYEAALNIFDKDYYDKVKSEECLKDS